MSAVITRTGIAFCWTMVTAMLVLSVFPTPLAVSGLGMRSYPCWRHWKQRFFVTRTPNDALSADRLLYQSPTGRNTARTVPQEFTGGRKQTVKGKGGQEWTIRSQKSQYLQGFSDSKLKVVDIDIIHPGKWSSNCP